MRAGLPTAVAPAGMGFTTTALEPTLPRPHGEAAEHLGACPTTTPRPECRMALGSADRARYHRASPLIDRAIVADLRGPAFDHHPHAVVDEHVGARSAPGWISIPASRRLT